MTRFISFLESIPYPESMVVHPKPIKLRYIFCLNLVICLYLAFILGANYTPINDAWVSYLNVERGQHTLPAYIEKIRTQGLTSRIFRGIPLFISSYLTSESFIAGKVFLFGLNLLTSIGIYLLTCSLFPTRRIFAAICALTYYFFPFDGTLFWLGASGVNISLFAGVFSIYFFHRALGEKSYRYLILACLFVILCCLSYVGPVTILMTFFGLFGILWIRNWRTRTQYFLIYLTSFFVANIPVLMEAISGEGRNSSVADFRVENIINNFQSMFKLLFMQFPSRLLSFDYKYLVGAGIIGVSTFLVLNFISREQSGESYNNEEKFTLIETITLSLIGFGIIICGFLPYSMTSLPIMENRTLLYSRAGLVLILINLGAYVLGKVFKSQKSYQTALSAFGSSVMFLAIQDKAVVAQTFHDESLKVRIFLGQLVETAPDYKPNSVFLIHLPSNHFTGKATMIVNRPHVPVQYVYDGRKTRVVTVTNFSLARHGLKEENGKLVFRRFSTNKENIISLKYNADTGFSPLTELNWTQLINKKRVKKSMSLPGDKNIVQTELTKRQKWFAEHQD